MAEQITVTAEKKVTGITVDLTGNTVGGYVDVLLTEVGETSTTSVSTNSTSRSIGDTSAEVRAAINTLTAAVLQWEAEDVPPAEPGEPEPPPV